MWEQPEKQHHTTNDNSYMAAARLFGLFFKQLKQMVFKNNWNNFLKIENKKYKKYNLAVNQLIVFVVFLVFKFIVAGLDSCRG